jgi:dienelactone hydrolase
MVAGCLHRALLVMVAVGVVSSLPIPTAGAASATGLSIRVGPPASLFDVPLDISARGLSARERATLQVSSVDRYGITWSAMATFVADGHGVIDPARRAPIAGTYAGVQAMGLIDSMSPQGSGGDSGYFWGGAPRSFRFTVSTRTNRRASTIIERSLETSGVTTTTVSLAATGLFAELWEPAPGTARQPAVLEFGGSEGGLSGQLLGALLASHGYPTLDLAYFNEPGLPPTLSNIPLEYFARALSWFGRQLNVDAHHIYVLGESRGSEAALLVGAYYPNLVAGVIASVPSNVSVCSPGCTGPVWTLNGQPLPYTRQFSNPTPTDTPGAVIPVERINGPILLVCGGADHVWDSCAYAQAIINRLAANHDPNPHLLVAEPQAGHGIGILVPYQPGIGASLNVAFRPFAPTQGTNLAANPIALAKTWPRFLNFLANRR